MQIDHVTVHFGEKNGKYPDGNQIVVRGSDTKVVFDTPLSSERLGDELEGSDAVLLGHVHEDHACGLHLLPDAAVYAPEQDVAALRSLEGLRAHYGYSTATWSAFSGLITEKFRFVPRPDARGYADGRVWELGGCRVRALHAPGHTAGHSVLLVEPEGVAFLGDIDLSGFGPYYGDATSSLTAFRATLRAVRTLDARVWVTFHHKGAVRERETFLELLDAFEQKIERRSEAMLRAIEGGADTLESLVAHRFLYPRGYGQSFVDDVERKTLMEHLAEFREAGRVVEEEGRLRVVG